MQPRVINCKAERPPEDSVYIGRGTKWGNPFKIGRDGDRQDVIRKYIEKMVKEKRLDEIEKELKGKDLVCWCKPEACHGDFLLLIANPPSDSFSAPLAGSE